MRKEMSEPIVYRDNTSDIVIKPAVLVNGYDQSDPVNHPSHYTDGGIETIDFILAKKMDFLLGQVCKYISRAGKKDPEKEIEDLEKAEFYLKRKIEVLKKQKQETGGE